MIRIGTNVRCRPDTPLRGIWAGHHALITGTVVENNGFVGVELDPRDSDARKALGITTDIVFMREHELEEIQ